MNRKFSLYFLLVVFLYIVKLSASYAQVLTAENNNKLGAELDMKVYWVGHSLMELPSKSPAGEIKVITLVGRLAEAAGFKYHMDYQSTGFANLSLMWSGTTHSHGRSELAMLEKRKAYEKNAKSFDKLVLTERIPVRSSYSYEYSSYYLQQFYCMQVQANPKSRVYLYEGWGWLHGDRSSFSALDNDYSKWRSKILSNRKVWNKIADEASKTQVPSPGLVSYFQSFVNKPKPLCKSEGPINIIPVGSALVELYDRLENPKKDDNFNLGNGERLSIGHLFKNAFVYDHSKEKQSGKPTLRNQKEEMDTIHISGIGIYYAALVSYAVLYEKSPVGLPSFGIVSDNVALTMQKIVHDVLKQDKTAGISQKL